MASSLLTKVRLKAGTSPDKVLAKDGWPKQSHLKIIQKDYNSELFGKLTMAVAGRRNLVKPDTKVPIPTPLFFPSFTQKDYEGMKSGYKDLMKMGADTATKIRGLDANIKKLVGPRDAKEADLKKFESEIGRLNALLDRMKETCAESANKCDIQYPARMKSYNEISRFYDLLSKTQKDIDKFDKTKKGKLLAAYKSLKKDLQDDLKVYLDATKEISKTLVELSFLMP